eukprot:34138-Rhodomonas_salina.5
MELRVRGTSNPLSSYALATRCPVLTWYMLLLGGGEAGARYGGTLGRIQGTYQPTRLLCPVRYRPRLTLHIILPGGLVLGERRIRPAMRY